MLPPDHYGCGLGCTRFTGTLAAVEEHERGCAHWLHNLLPEGLQCDLFGGNEDELALTLLDIVEPLQYPLSVLQKARRHATASPLLVASEEMPPLESADRYPAPSQKLPTSKQPTLPVAPTLAPPLSSALIAPSSLSLNLLPMNPPSQTGDSHLVAYTTIDSSRKEKVPQQQGQDIGRPASNLVVKVTQSPAISPGHWGFVLKMRSPTRASGFVWQYSPLSECCNDNLFRHPATTADTVIPCSSTLVDRPPSLLPFPIERPTSVLAAIDIFAHRPGADRRRQRGGDICGSEHGITSSQRQWHPAHSCFPLPCSFFFLFPF